MIRKRPWKEAENLGYARHGDQAGQAVSRDLHKMSDIGSYSSCRISIFFPVFQIESRSSFHRSPERAWGLSLLKSSKGIERALVSQP